MKIKGRRGTKETKECAMKSEKDKPLSDANNQLFAPEHPRVNVKLIHVCLTDIPSFSCLNNWQQLFDFDLLTGPIVQKENIAINRIPGYRVTRRKVFLKPMAVRSTIKA